MKRPVFDMSTEGFKFDIDITVSLSKAEEFSKNYEKRRWESGKEGSVYYFLPPTLGLRSAKKLCENLPDYAKVSNVAVYLPDGHKIFEGPLNISLEDATSLLNEWTSHSEERLEKYIKERLEKLENEASLRPTYRNRKMNEKIMDSLLKWFEKN